MSNEPSAPTIPAPEIQPADAPLRRHRGSRWPNPITIGVSDSDLRSIDGMAARFRVSRAVAARACLKHGIQRAPRALKRRLREGGGIRAE